MAIGFVVINWALVERQIDYAVSIAFKNCGGKKLRKKGDIPRSLSQKLDFLKLSFNRFEVLKAFKSDGEKLICRTNELSDRRHDLVHGTITSMEPVDGAFTFQMVKYAKEDHLYPPEFKFDPSEFDMLAKSLGDHLTELIAFVGKLADTFLGQKE